MRCTTCDLRFKFPMTAFDRLMARSGLTSRSNLFHSEDMPPAEKQWNDAHRAKAAIDETPGKRNSAERPGNKRERNDSGTCDEAKGDDPFVPDRVDPRPNERHCNHEMGKGEPVRSVSNERVSGIRLGDSAVDFIDPAKQAC